MQQILVAVNNFTDAHLQKIEHACSGWAKVSRIDQTVDAKAYEVVLKSSDVVVGWPPPSALAETNVRFAQLCSAGYDPYLKVSLDQKEGFRLCNARGVFSVPAAEQTIAMMLALTRRLNFHIREQQQQVWQRADDYQTVYRSTMCVVGLGSIGTAIAERCHALGMSVIGVTRTGKDSAKPPVDAIYAFDDLREAVAISDHVAVSIPETSKTVGVFDEAMFRSMKRGGYFYNVGRGALVVEPDLVRVLEDGHLRGAGLDVFVAEPLPDNHPFWGMPNVIIAPHVAGRCLQEFDLLCDLFVENLLRYHASKSLKNQIDLSQ